MEKQLVTAWPLPRGILRASCQSAEVLLSGPKWLLIEMAGRFGSEEAAMVRNGEITVAEVRRVLRRYWWIPALTTVALGAMGLAASLVLPKKYTSSTLVLVEQPTVPIPVGSDHQQIQPVSAAAADHPHVRSGGAARRPDRRAADPGDDWLRQPP